MEIDEILRIEQERPFADGVVLDTLVNDDASNRMLALVYQSNSIHFPPAPFLMPCRYCTTAAADLEIVSCLSSSFRW